MSSIASQKPNRKRSGWRFISSPIAESAIVKRVLVYGFGVYRGFAANVTETILRRLPRPRGLKKIVFPVRFHRGPFVRAVKAHDPDVILGLGQCSKGKKLRIESQALNRRRQDKNEKAKPIVRGG